jgi:prepilin peptidase CpaA
MYWNALVLAYAITVAISDAVWGKIPRVLTVLAFLAGLVFHFFAGGAVDLGSAALAAFVAFGLGLTLFRLGAIGGGDVKLMTALGALLGFTPWLHAMKFAVFVAGAIAIIQVLRRRAVAQTLRNMKDIVGNLAERGLMAHESINVNNRAMIRAPFGVAVAVGTLISMVVQRV